MVQINAYFIDLSIELVHNIENIGFFKNSDQMWEVLAWYHYGENGKRKI